MQDTVREAGMSSSVMFSYRSPHMAKQGKETGSNLQTATLWG